MDGNKSTAWRARPPRGRSLCSGVSPRSPAPARADDEPGSLSKMDFGKTPDGTPVELYVLKNGHAHRQGHDLRSHHHRDRRPRPQRQGRAMSSWDSTISTDTSATSPTSGRPSAGSRTGSPRGSSPWTGRSTRWPPTTGPTACTAGSRASTRWSGRPSAVASAEGPSVKHDLSQPRRRGRLSGQPRRQRARSPSPPRTSSRSSTRPRPTRPRRSTSSNHSYFNLAGRTTESILGHELMLRRRQLHARGRDPDPDRRDRARRRHAARLHQPHRHRQARIKRDQGRPRGLRPQLRAQQRRQVAGPGGPGLRAQDRPGPGDVHHRARRPVLHAATSSTGPSPARTASSTASTTASAWRPSTSPTRSTTRTSPRRSSSRGRPTPRRRSTSSRPK